MKKELYSHKLTQFIYQCEKIGPPSVGIPSYWKIRNVQNSFDEKIISGTLFSETYKKIRKNK